MRVSFFSFRGALVFFAAILFGSFFAAAQDDLYPTGPEAGRELAAKLRAIKPQEDTSWHGEIRIFGRGRTIAPVPVSCQVIVGETNWTETFVTMPTDTNLAAKFVIVFSTNGPNQYFYAQAAKPNQPPGAVKPISAAEADIPIGGSDFWLSDLGLEFLHWPEQFRLKGDIHSGRGRYVLVSSNPHPAPGGYSRVKTWIDKQSDQPTEADAYGAVNTNKIVKSFSLEKVAKVGDRYEVKEMDINGEGKFWSRLVIDVEGDKNKK